MANLPKAFVAAFMVSCLENSAFHHRLSPVATTTHHHFCSHRPRVIFKMGYVPDGLSKEQYEDIKRRDAAAKKANLDRVGHNRFKSRSFEAFQKALENGEATHLFPVDPNDYKKGKVEYEDLPHMQRRGGAWDNSDLKGVKRNVYDNPPVGGVTNQTTDLTKPQTKRRRARGLFARLWW